MTTASTNGQITKEQASNGTPVMRTDNFQLVLDDGISDDVLAKILSARAYDLAKLPPEDADGEILNLLVFILDGGRYGIEIAYVREIRPVTQLTPVPRTPDFIVGIFSSRGRLISIIDLRAFAGLPKTGLTDESKIIVVANEDTGMEIGFLADNVEDVANVFADELQPALTTQTGRRAKFTKGITPGLLTVLDLNALLNDTKLVVQEELTAVAKGSLY